MSDTPARSEQGNSLEARLERALVEGDIDAVRAINAERRSEQSNSRAFIDARCGCRWCVERTANVYRMIGKCRNCGTEALLLYRVGDEARDVDCPVCGNRWTVSASRLATPDEIPAGCSS